MTEHATWCEGFHLQTGPDRGACAVERTIIGDPDDVVVQLADISGGIYVSEIDGSARLLVDTDDPEIATLEFVEHLSGVGDA